ncbi:MAG: S1C family serine protease, partial [Vulcanimicrobiaceae bacterium]
MKKVIAPLLAGLIGGLGGGALVFAGDGQHLGNGLMPPAAVAAGEDDQQRIIEAVHHAEPSVVALNVVVNGKQIVPTDPFNMFFGNGLGGEQLVPFHGKASGSGFVYSKSGLIVTNDHVVHGASSIQVVFNDGKKVDGKIYAEDHAADLALVKVDAANLPPPLELASSRNIRQGEWAVAIGEPLQLQD